MVCTLSFLSGNLRRAVKQRKPIGSTTARLNAWMPLESADDTPGDRPILELLLQDHDGGIMMEGYGRFQRRAAAPRVGTTSNPNSSSRTSGQTRVCVCACVCDLDCPGPRGPEWWCHLCPAASDAGLYRSDALGRKCVADQVETKRLRVRHDDPRRLAHLRHESTQDADRQWLTHEASKATG